jgi:hypothetical protein
VLVLWQSFEYSSHGSFDNDDDVSFGDTEGNETDDESTDKRLYGEDDKDLEVSGDGNNAPNELPQLTIRFTFNMPVIMTPISKL